MAESGASCGAGNGVRFTWRRSQVQEFRPSRPGHLHRSIKADGKVVGGADAASSSENPAQDEQRSPSGIHLLARSLSCPPNLLISFESEGVGPSDPEIERLSSKTIDSMPLQEGIDPGKYFAGQCDLSIRLTTR